MKMCLPLARSTTTIRVSKDLHRFLKRKAGELGMSIGDFIYYKVTGENPPRSRVSVPVAVIQEPYQRSLVSRDYEGVYLG